LEFSSNKKERIEENSFENEIIHSFHEKTLNKLYNKIRNDRIKRQELEIKVSQSIKEIDSVKVKLQFLEEKLLNNIIQNIPSSHQSNQFILIY